MNELRLPRPAPMPPALTAALGRRRRARLVVPGLIAAACAAAVSVMVLEQRQRPALILPPSPLRATVEQPTLANLRHADPGKLTSGNVGGGGRSLRVSSLRTPEAVAEWYGGR